MRRLPSQLASLQRLLDSITLAFIAEPLFAVDADADCSAVAAKLEAHGFDECGVRLDGAVTHFVKAADVKGGSVGQNCREIPSHRIGSVEEALWTSMDKLARHGTLYLKSGRAVEQIVTKADLNKQPARLLMFGIVSLLEMALLALIRKHRPDESWLEQLKPNRIDKARELHKARLQRREEIDLADCLQLCDKADICIAVPAIMDAWGKSKTASRTLFKALGEIRDNLAHAQSPSIGNDWATALRTLDEGRAVLQYSVHMLDNVGSNPAKSGLTKQV